MVDKNYILAIDQGTTSSRAIVFDSQANIISVAQQEFPQIYPANGWVEHDPEAIWSSTLTVVREAIASAETHGGKVLAIGITNQRETTVIWDRNTGKPIANAIVWQDRRTADLCANMQEQGLENEVQMRTGLRLDPYFSATKIAWLLDNVEGARKRTENGDLAFGTVDSFLIWKLTNGASHLTDITNASRTNLYNIRKLEWDSELLRIFNIPTSLLPEVRDCAANFGDTESTLLGRSIPILGVAGDQQAAAIGQCCFEPGSIKSTYGTGCFVLFNTGTEILTSKNQLLSTIAYKIDNQLAYALEGSIFIAGAAVQWLRDTLGIIDHVKETETLASSLEDNAGVYMVPAFTGLGAPHWDPHARGAILGLTRASGKAEIVRATLESICYQTHDLLQAMHDDGAHATTLRVDGGMANNGWLMQYLANIVNLTVEQPNIMETTALGAAYLAGMQIGVWGSFQALNEQWHCKQRFKPNIAPEQRTQLLQGWNNAIQRIT